jgi:integrase
VTDIDGAGQGDREAGGRRPNGAGSVEVLPDGRARIRAPVEGKRRQLGKIYPDEASALRMLAIWNAARSAGEVIAPTELTLAKYGADVLDLRELDGSRVRVTVRDIANERSTWTRHVLESPLASRPIASITERDVDAFVMWLRRRKAVSAITKGRGATKTIQHRETDRVLARSTQKHALRILRTVLEEAQRGGLIDRNPAAGARVATGGRAKDLSDDWLRQGEINQLLACEKIPLVDRRAYACAIGLALRLHDLHSVRVEHVRLEATIPGPYVEVAIGKIDGKIHRVPVMPWLLPILRDQIASLKKGARWLFPTRDGSRYHKSHDFGWAQKVEAGRPRRPGALELAGIERRVRFHDLRGSAATHLAIGSWGRRWSLHEIQSMLAHSDQRVTERYVKRALSALSAAAAETLSGPALAAPRCPETLDGAMVVSVGNREERALQDSNLRPSAPEAQTDLVWSPLVAGESGQRMGNAARAWIDAGLVGQLTTAHVDELVASVRESELVRLAEEVAEGGPHLVRRGSRLAETILRALLAGARVRDTRSA